jgi:hypothetical protein
MREDFFARNSLTLITGIRMFTLLTKEKTKKSLKSNSRRKRKRSSTNKKSYARPDKMKF